MNVQKFLREATEAITAVAPVVGVEHGKAHYKFRIRTPQGERLLVCPHSTANPYALTILRRQARHLMAGRTAQ